MPRRFGREVASAARRPSTHSAALSSVAVAPPRLPPPPCGARTGTTLATTPPPYRTSKLTYYTATTLDGFIADPDDSLTWLFAQGGADAGEATRGNPLGYDEFIAGIGAIVMGSTTYEWVLDHEKGAWPFDLPAWVMTTRELTTPDGANVRFASGDVGPVHDAMVEAANGKDLWVVGGGDLSGQFADAGLLDEVITFVAPVTLGAGRPLLPRRLQLRPVETHADAFVATRYEVTGPGQWT